MLVSKDGQEIDNTLCGLRDESEIKFAAENLRLQLLKHKEKHRHAPFFERGLAKYQTLLWVLGMQEKRVYPEILDAEVQLSDMMGF